MWSTLAKIAYHASCHLQRELGADRQPRMLLKAVRDAQLVELPGAEECCGFGGVFSAEHPEISTAMLQRKLANIEHSGAEVIVSCDAGCLTNINGGLKRQGKTPRRDAPGPGTGQPLRRTGDEFAFPSQIRSALSDPSLQEALDINCRRSLEATANVSSILFSDLAELRRRAHAIKAETITNLEHYLDVFIQHAHANGMIVHQAQDATEANEIVREIIRQAGGKVIAKSKTMVSEETRLNQALEADGLQAVETDLGEYIVQLRGEPPAHIIAPAVHLTRRQVGLTFQEKLGLPFTDDIPTLTAAARKELRQTFLRADIGISGVNFGVAETGAICLLTNEGNGRMATTLPDVHIALMGIERLVPSLADLAVMLDLLPYSATGQRLTVYTSLIRGPRRAGEIDGPRQRHLVLLDNGRRALRDSDLAEMLYCIRCGACLNVCPVFREIGGHAYVGASGKHTPYPGPMGSVVSPGLFGAAEFGNLARASSLCGACQEACPVDIPLPKLLLRVRAAGAEANKVMMPKEWIAEDAVQTAAVTAAPTPAGPAAQPQAYRKHVPWALELGLRLFTWGAVSAGRFAGLQRQPARFPAWFHPAPNGCTCLPSPVGHQPRFSPPLKPPVPG